MLTPFQKQIENSTAHRPIRDQLSGLVVDSPKLLEELLSMAFNVSAKNHHKACWILELVMEAKIEWLEPHLDTFCKKLKEFTNESALRPISKICLFATEYHKKTRQFLNPGHIEQIIESCFDWLISPETKVATKAYAMRTLYLLGQNEEWIHPELSRILAEDASKHTAAYKGAARDILKRINK